MGRQPKGAGWGQVTAGVIVLAIGLALLLTELDLVHPLEIGRLWPLILVAVGASRVIGDTGESRRGGFIVLFVGCWLLINTLELFGLDWDTSWPLVLVAVGLGRFLGSSSAGGRSPGVLLILIGLALQAFVLGAFGLGLAHGWPLILVVLGLWIIFRAFQGEAKAGAGRKDS